MGFKEKIVYGVLGASAAVVLGALFLGDSWAGDIMSERMRSEKKAIAEHQENKVDNIQNELTIQLLSFTGLQLLSVLV